MNFRSNPASRRIIQTAKNAFAFAGLSVQGLLPHWQATPNDPGKMWFWRQGLIECGVDPAAAYRAVEDLDRAHRAW